MDDGLAGSKRSAQAFAFFEPGDEKAACAFFPEAPRYCGRAQPIAVGLDHRAHLRARGLSAQGMEIGRQGVQVDG